MPNDQLRKPIDIDIDNINTALERIKESWGSLERQKRYWEIRAQEFLS